MIRWVIVSILTFSSIWMLIIANADETKAIALSQLLENGQCPNCDLRGVDFSFRQLTGVNLNSADLRGSNLTGTNLRGANLQNANLLGVILIDTKLAGANLKNANLSDLDIDEVFESIEIIGTQLEGARFLHGVICGPPPRKGGWGCEHH